MSDDNNKDIILNQLLDNFIDRDKLDTAIANNAIFKLPYRRDHLAIECLTEVVNVDVKLKLNRASYSYDWDKLEMVYSTKYGDFHVKKFARDLGVDPKSFDLNFGNSYNKFDDKSLISEELKTLGFVLNKQDFKAKTTELRSSDYILGSIRRYSHKPNKIFCIEYLTGIKISKTARLDKLYNHLNNLEIKSPILDLYKIHQIINQHCPYGAFESNHRLMDVFLLLGIAPKTNLKRWKECKDHAYFTTKSMPTDTLQE